jgi:hypothetical protein
MLAVGLRGDGRMRTYLTAAGLALGLVAVWAALVPLFAWIRRWASPEDDLNHPDCRRIRGDSC